MNAFYRWLRRLLLLIIIPVIIAASLSYNLWGYSFAPPSIDRLAGGMAINSLSYIEYAPEGNIALLENASPDEMMYRYYEPPSHIDDYARRRGVINLTPADEALLTAIDQAILTLGWEIYPDDVSLIGGNGRQPGGFVVVGEQYDTSKMVLVGLASARLDLIHYDPNSDGDSYRAYEALFELRPDGGLRLVNQQSYRFDSAGLEALQFPVLLLLTYMLYLPVLGIGTAIVRRGRRVNAVEPVEKRKYEGDEAANLDTVNLFDLLSPDEAQDDDLDGEMDIAKAEARFKS